MDIYCPYIRVSTHGHVQNIGQIPQNPSLIFQAFEIFTKEIFSKNSKKILTCHIWHVGWSWQVSCHGE